MMETVAYSMQGVDESVVAVMQRTDEHWCF